MNKIVCKIAKAESNPQAGDIYSSTVVGDIVKGYYILTRYDQLWSAVNPATGSVWDAPDRLDIAIKGLTFVKRGAKITIE